MMDATLQQDLMPTQINLPGTRYNGLAQISGQRLVEKKSLGPYLGAIGHPRIMTKTIPTSGKSCSRCCLRTSPC